MRLTLAAQKLGVLNVCSWSNFSSPAKFNFQVGIHLTSPEALACLIVIQVLYSCAARLSAKCEKTASSCGLVHIRTPNILPKMQAKVVLKMNKVFH